MPKYMVPEGHQYSAGTSFSAPQSITEKPMDVYYLDEWIIITLHVAGFLKHPAICWYFHHNSDKSGLKVADCTIQSAEYWWFYGTPLKPQALHVNKWPTNRRRLRRGWMRENWYVLSGKDIVVVTHSTCIQCYLYTLLKPKRYKACIMWSVESWIPWLWFTLCKFRL